ncbi:hypothetical protein PBI_HILLTOPFARM_123 [Mycobacterium phage Hilltopfarm]|nr:hypothetical protein PBI_HILLTOPFARM_123 [Mycobacterium phage Hilltopfarm]
MPPARHAAAILPQVAEHHLLYPCCWHRCAQMSIDGPRSPGAVSRCQALSVVGRVNLVR